MFFSRLAVVGHLVSALSYFRGQEFKELVDDVLDVFEKHGAEIPGVLGICSTARSVLNVPDDDTDQQNPV